MVQRIDINYVSLRDCGGGKRERTVVVVNSGHIADYYAQYIITKHNFTLHSLI